MREHIIYLQAVNIHNVQRNLELSNKKVRKSAFEMGQGFE